MRSYARLQLFIYGPMLAALFIFSLLTLMTGAAAGPAFNDPNFASTWNRIDKPITDLSGEAGRGFTWGQAIPQAAAITKESYGVGQRTVQYFDKARMEINNPGGNPNDLFYITTGLLVKELVTGQRQDGNNSFTQLQPSEVQVAGDTNEAGGNAIAPTYASFRFTGTFSGTENGHPNQASAIINTALDRAGAITTLDQAPEIRLLKGYDNVTQHNIADVFVDFGYSAGPVWDGNSFINGPVFYGNPVYILGRPLTEPCWVRAVVRGIEQPVLVQLFERRLLTYTPSNPDPYKVEMGNLGQHYYRWRYVENNQLPATPTPASAPTPAPTPTPPLPPANTSSYGLNTLLNLYSLPQLDSYSQTYEVSSHDLNGGNIDFGSYLFWQGSSKVIFDELGPGVVTRIWMTNYPNQDFSRIGRIQIFVDGNEDPTVDLSAADFFSGRTPPLLAPLVGNASVSSGGYFSYLPLSFNSRLRIAVTGNPGYYQINYQKLSGVGNIASFTGKEDYSQVLKYLSNPGVDPKPASPGRQLLTGNGQIVPSQELVIANLEGPAVISSLKFKLGITDPNLITRLYIRIQWEGRSQAQVEAPFDYFFGSGINEKEVKGLMVGMKPATHEYYCYFPMPFHQQARITIFSKASKAIPVNWEIGLDPDPEGLVVNNNSGYFNATFRNEHETPQGLDYKILDVKGRGRYVGTVVHFYGHYSLPEGDDRTYIDGSNTPHIYGTGLEDYFNGAYGFNKGQFSLPLNGSPYHHLGVNENTDIVGYRFLLADAVNFNESLRFGFEQGYIGQDKPTPGQDYNSLAFWYALNPGNLALTDDLNVAEPASAGAHAYSNSGVVFKGSLISYFEGQQDNYPFTDQGYNLQRGSQFKVNIYPQNSGVILRRRFDYSLINQQALIYVDGQLVGLWFSPGNNQQIRWREEDFTIPAAITNGKSTLNIRVEPIVDLSPWTEYYYAVFTLVR